MEKTTHSVELEGYKVTGWGDLPQVESMALDAIKIAYYKGSATLIYKGIDLDLGKLVEMARVDVERVGA